MYGRRWDGPFSESLVVLTTNITADYSLVTNRPNYSTDKDDALPLGMYVMSGTGDLALKDKNGVDTVWPIAAAHHGMFIAGAYDQIDDGLTSDGITVIVVWA